MHPRFNSRGLWFVVFLNFFFLVLFFAFFEYQIIQIRDNKNIITPTPVVVTSAQPTPTPVVISPVFTITPSATPLLTTKTNEVSVNNKITYIPLTGGTTQSTSWVDIPGTNFSFNIGDYGTKAYVTWDANLRVTNKNDTTHVRLYDKTHGIAVNGSELSITDTYTSTDVVSGQLSFWAGNNSYVVQIRSLTGSVSYMDSGRIKISY